MKICKNCTLPSTVPSARIDDSGLCVYCRQFKGKEELERQREEYRLRFQALVDEHGAHPGGLLPVGDGPLYGSGAPQLRKQGGMEVHGSPRGDVDDRTGQDLPVGDHHLELRRKAPKRVEIPW